MTSLERVQAVLHGQVPDRLPVIPQSFMFSAHTAGYSIGQINRSPRLMAESHRICQEKYGYDGCVIDVDDATLAEACGAKVNWRDDNVACVDEHHPALKDLRDIDSLRMPDPYRDGRLPEWLEITQRLCEMVGDHVFVMGRADQGPFDLLCLLRGTQTFMVDLLEEDEEVILHAMEWTTKAHIAFANAQIATGAHATSMGDAYASPNLVSGNVYRKFAKPFEVQVVDAVQRENAPYSIHICGDTTKIIRDMGQTGAKILEVDWKLDMGLAHRSLPESTVLMGNINPSDPIYIGTPEQVLAQCKDVIEKTRGQGLLLSSGCAIGANAKPENIAALVEAARLYGTRDQLLELRARALPEE